MYPLKHQKLLLPDVAYHWRRFVEGSPTAEELSDLLLAGFWRGELILRGDGRAPLSREAALGALRDTVVGAQGIDQVAVDLAFWAKDEEGELGPRERWRPDGGVEVDPRTRVRLPATPQDWSEEVLEAAFAALAEVSLKRLPLTFRFGVDAQQVLKADFARFCDLNGYARPAFWFGPSERKPQPRTTAATVARFHRWFAQQVQGPQLYSREDYCRLAQREFAGLSASQFNEEWGRSAPEAWKKPGRRRGLLTLPQD